MTQTITGLSQREAEFLVKGPPSDIVSAAGLMQRRATFEAD